MQRHERHGDTEAKQAALIERLTAFIERLRDRLAPVDCDFAIEFAENGEWELAIEAIDAASRHELLLTITERQHLRDISASLGRLAPEVAWRSFGRLLRGLLRSRRSLRGPVPAVIRAEESAPTRSEPPSLVDAMPTVAGWLREGLNLDGEQELAEQVDTARIHALCGCGDDSCFSFYLAPPIPVSERPGKYTGMAPRGFESVAIDNGQLAWVQHDFRGPAELLTDEGRRAIGEYQSLVGVVPRAR